MRKTCLAGLYVALILTFGCGQIAVLAKSAPTPAYFSTTPERPVFLSWPLPVSVPVSRISMYPNSPWTWHFLGLNPGMQCPPAFGYLDDVSSWAYWRDRSLPEKQDRAQADPHEFQMVECYSTDSPAGTNGHEGTDIKAAAGTAVYAAAAGRVAGWQVFGLYTMIELKHCLGGAWDADNACMGGTQWYTTYMHINLDPELKVLGKQVPSGSQLGSVYDQTINSHLHFEVGLDQRLYANFVNPWGRDQAPWDGCMWEDRSRCAYPDPPVQRMAFTDASAGLFVQQGGPNSPWVYQGRGFDQVALAGERVAVLDCENNLRIKEGPLSAGWVLQPGKIRVFRLAGRWIVAIDNLGRLVAKQGLYDDWAVMASAVTQIGVAPNRLGFVDTAGDLYVREAGLDNGWVLEQRGVRAFQISTERLAVLNAAGELLGKSGNLRAAWVRVATNIVAFRLENRRLAALDGNGNLMVKEGALFAHWDRAAGGVASFELSGSRLVVLDAGGRLWLTNGDTNAPWTEIIVPHVRDFELSGPD